MRLNELLEIVNAAYPDGATRACWDAKKRKARKDMGDTLAEFVVREIADTYDGMATNDEQLNDALEAMRRAAAELGAVIASLEKRKDERVRKAGALIATDWMSAGEQAQADRRRHDLRQGGKP